MTRCKGRLHIWPACLLVAALPWQRAAEAGAAVVNDAGIPVKLITTRPCKLHSRPDPKSESSPCRAFQYWYVLPPKSGATRRLADLPSITRNGYYRVASGNTESEFRGWVHKDHVVEWHHRQALRFAPSTGRKPAHFFPTKDEAVRACATGHLERATHREPRRATGELILMPLLAAEKVTVDEQQMFTFRVAFMTGKPAAAPRSEEPRPSASPGKLTREEVRRRSTVDIVFAIDTTGSMRPTISQVRNSIARVTRALASQPALRNRLRFGLVGYRDHTAPGTHENSYVTKTFCNLAEGKNHKTFLTRLQTLACAGGGDIPEDVLAGVVTAMGEPMRWNPVGWKQIIVVADASMREPSHPARTARKVHGDHTIAEVKARAQPGSGKLEEKLKSGFVLSAIHVRQPGQAADHSAGERQFNEMVSGRSYRGNLIVVKGGVKPEDFSARLTKSINEKVSAFDQAVVKGRLRAADVSGKSAADYPIPVLELLADLGDEAPKGPGMRFASRFCTEFDNDLSRVFQPYVFVRKGQLKSFIALLSYLQGSLEDAGDPGSRDVEAVVRNMRLAAATLQYDEPIDRDLPLNRIFALILGIPVKADIFKLTIEDLAAMSQTDYDDWVRNVKRTTGTLESLIENPNIWYKLYPGAKEREEHAFIALHDLP